MAVVAFLKTGSERSLDEAIISPCSVRRSWRARPRFEYSGYTFVLVDPWPPEWAYSDDCYIDDVDGEYFLFDMRHPGAQLALILVM